MARDYGSEEEERARNQTREEWLREYTETLNKREVEKMDMTKYASSESNDLKAKDFIGKNLKVVISNVEVRNYPETEDRPASSKPVLSFKGKEKTLVLNATNTKTLCEAYGTEDTGWIGHEIGLSVADYTGKGFGHGWVVRPLDVAEPEFEDQIPF